MATPIVVPGSMPTMMYLRNFADEYAITNIYSTSYLYGEIYNIVLVKMKAYELPVKVTPDGNLDLPDALMKMLPRSQIVRVIILVNEPRDINEQSAWSRLTAEQFLAGYCEGDAVYDTLR